MQVGAALSTNSINLTNLGPTSSIIRSKIAPIVGSTPEAAERRRMEGCGLPSAPSRVGGEGGGSLSACMIAADGVIATLALSGPASPIVRYGGGGGGGGGIDGGEALDPAALRPSATGEIEERRARLACVLA